MAIMSIADLESASEEEVKEAFSHVTVLDDLKKYILWLNSTSGERTTGEFTVGFDSGRAASKGLHPSSLSKADPCLKKLYFEATGEVEPDYRYGVELIMTFDLGTCLHSLVQLHLKNMYESAFQEEVKLKDPKIMIYSSHTDGRFVFQSVGVKFLIELKSIKEGGSYGFSRVKDKPLQDHVNQVTTYMKLDDCPFGLIFYVCKNNGEMLEHPLVFDQKIWDRLNKRTVLPVLNAVEEGRAPIASPGWACRTCEYLHGCQEGKDHVNGRKKTDRRRGTRTAGPRSALARRRRRR